MPAFKRTTLVSLLLPALFLAASCTKDGREGREEAHIVIALLCGNNSLSDEAALKAARLVEGFTYASREGDCLLLFVHDRETAPVLTEYRREKGAVREETLGRWGTASSANPAVLEEVLSAVTRRHAGKKMGLVVFSHASGWLPAGAFQNPLATPRKTRSIITDRNAEMELEDFAGAIPDGVFSYLVFETCFMSGVEAAYALRHKAPLIFASSAEIVSPGFTELYPKVFPYLLSGNLEALGETVFQAADKAQGYFRSAAYSLIRTAALEPLHSFVKEHISLSLVSDETVLDSMQHFDRNSYHLFFDAGQYYASRLPSARLRARLEELIDDCVVWKGATPSFMEGYSSFDIRYHSGLTTYIPQSWFPGLNEAWQQTSWCR